MACEPAGAMKIVDCGHNRMLSKVRIEVLTISSDLHDKFAILAIRSAVDWVCFVPHRYVTSEKWHV